MMLNKDETRELYRRRAKRYDLSVQLYRVFGFRVDRYRQDAISALGLGPGDFNSLTNPILQDRMRGMSTHTSHPEIIKRLKRAEGHLRSTIAMLEDSRDCLAIAQQLQAVESAVGNAKKTLVHDHIDHCLKQAVRDAPQSAEETIREFKAITKYL
jgi:DNA-binding FrmR family transcriptional regulator